MKMKSLLLSSVPVFFLLNPVLPTYAMCLSTSGENNCATFNGNSLSHVIQTYTSSNLSTNRFFQLGFRSQGASAVVINNIAYSTDGTAFTSVTGSISTTTNFQYISVQNPFGSVALNHPFYLSYDIQPIVPMGTSVDSLFLANNTGSTTSGVLDFNGGNFEAVERSHASVPAPLPFLGAAVVASRIKRIKITANRLKKKIETH
jgi:hypothetical protein